MKLFGTALLTNVAIRSLRCSLVALIEFVAAKIAAWHSGAGRTLAGIFPAMAAANLQTKSLPLESALVD